MSDGAMAPKPQAELDQEIRAGRLKSSWNKVSGLALPIGALIVLILLFGIWNPKFLTFLSLDNIMRQFGFLAILALAGTLAIMIGGIDLSVAANATLGGVIVARFVDQTFVGAVLAVIVACSIVGLVNGVIITKLKVPSFLVTLGVWYICDGISQIICGGGPLPFFDQKLAFLVNRTSIPSVPNGFILTVVIIALLTVVALYTKYGRHLYAVGGNERAARLAGVRVDWLKISVFTIGGALAGVAGMIFTAQASSGTPLGVDPSLINSIAAIVIGGTALSGGVGGPHRTLLGALVIIVLSSGMNIVSMDPFAQLIVKGAVVIAAVAVTIDRRRYGMIK